MTPEHEWLGTQAVANQLHVNVRTVYRLIDEGKLAAYKVGRVIRIKSTDVDAFLETQRIPMRVGRYGS